MLGRRVARVVGGIYQDRVLDDIMSISEKNRKILWGRSGNRCAICKCELVVNANNKDAESIIGEECHINSAKERGPRYDPTLAKGKLHQYDNLILLCRTHHKVVDDQQETYTVSILQQIKNNHEVSISRRLSGDDNNKKEPIRLRRVEKGIPRFLSRMTTGKQILDLVMTADGYANEHEELNSEEECDLVGGFLQETHDWGEIGDDLEPHDRVRAAFSLSKSLKEVEDAGFFVFGGSEVRELAGGELEEPIGFVIVILQVYRNSNGKIVTIKLESEK